MKKFYLFFSVIFLLSVVLVNFSNAQELSKKLNGKILLQVESVGQSWYVDPETSERAFLGRPADAFRIMRELGLGVSEKDFNLFSENVPSKLSGRILLRVEASGEAYYVFPDDLKMYYLGRPDDAFNIMREKGLGITDKNLDKIPVFQKYKEQDGISCTSWIYSGWGDCSQNGQQNRSIVSSSPSGCIGGDPIISQSCITSPPTCTLWAYSDWSDCSQIGQQTRSIISSSPNGCINGIPVLARSCVFVEPIQSGPHLSINDPDYLNFKLMFTVNERQRTAANEILYDVDYNGSMNQEDFWLYFSSINTELKGEYAKLFARETRNDSSKYIVALYFNYSDIKLGYSFAYPPDNYYPNGNELASFTINPFLLD